MRLIAPFVMVLVAGAIAGAQPRSEGARLFDEGRELAKAGKFAEACDAFEKSIALDRAPGTALNYGDCLEHLGQLRKALQMYDEAAREFDKQNDPRGKFARERATAVTPKLGTLTVKVADPALSGLVITLGKESVPPQKKIVDRFEPGTIEVTASAPGKTGFSSSARVVAGATVIVEVPVLGGGDGGTPNPPVDHPSGRRDRARVRLALGVGAAGGAALVISGILGLSARSTYHGAIDDMQCIHQGGMLVCNQTGADAVNSAATRANIATGVAIGGAVLVGAAVVLFVTAPREAMTVSPAATATSVGLSFGRTF